MGLYEFRLRKSFTTTENKYSSKSIVFGMVKTDTSHTFTHDPIDTLSAESGRTFLLSYYQRNLVTGKVFPYLPFSQKKIVDF